MIAVDAGIVIIVGNVVDVVETLPFEVQTVERLVEVPQVHFVDKIVEVPEAPRWRHALRGRKHRRDAWAVCCRE